MADSTPRPPEPLAPGELALLDAYREQRAMPRAAKSRVGARLDESRVAVSTRATGRPVVIGLAVLGVIAAAVLLTFGVSALRGTGIASNDDPYGAQAPMVERSSGPDGRATPRTRPSDQARPTRTSTATADSTSPETAEPEPPAAPVEATSVEHAPTEPAEPASGRRRPANSRATTHAKRPPVEPAPAEPPPAEPPLSPIAQERAVLTQAWAALARGDDAAALRHTKSHAERFASGVLTVERDAIATIAGCHLKRSGWSAQADHFLAAHGKTPSARRVREACTPPSDEG